jgi:hypothetical protein
MNMNSSNRWFQQNLTKIAAALIVAILFIQAREPRISASERSTLALRFHFVCYTLPGSTTAPLARTSATRGLSLHLYALLNRKSSPKAVAIEPARIPAAAAEVAQLKQA